MNIVISIDTKVYNLNDVLEHLHDDLQYNHGVGGITQDILQQVYNAIKIQKQVKK